MDRQKLNPDNTPRVASTDDTSVPKPEWAQERDARQLRGEGANDKALGQGGKEKQKAAAERKALNHGLPELGDEEVGTKTQRQFGNRGAVVGKINGPDGVVGEDDTIESLEPQFAPNPDMQ